MFTFLGFTTWFWLINTGRLVATPYGIVLFMAVGTALDLYRGRHRIPQIMQGFKLIAAKLKSR